MEERERRAERTYGGIWGFGRLKTPGELKGKIMSFQIGPDRKEIHITSQLVSGPIARGGKFLNENLVE